MCRVVRYVAERRLRAINVIRPAKFLLTFRLQVVCLKFMCSHRALTSWGLCLLGKLSEGKKLAGVRPDILIGRVGRWWRSLRGVR